MKPHVTTDTTMQVSINAWKSPAWREFANTFPVVTGLLCGIVGLLVLGNRADAHFAPYIFLLAFICLLTIFPLRSLGHGNYTICLDRSANTLQIIRPGSHLAGMANSAGQIERISCILNKTSRLNTLWHLNPSMPLLWKKSEWLIAVKKSRSEHFFPIEGSGLATENEAQQIVDKFNSMLVNNAPHTGS